MSLGVAEQVLVLVLVLVFLDRENNNNETCYMYPRTYDVIKFSVFSFFKRGS